MLTKAGYESAMISLGAHDELMTASEGEMLDRDGFIIFHDVIDADWIESVRLRIDELIQIESAADVSRTNTTSEFRREPGCVRLGDLVNKGQVFDRIWQHPRVLAAARRVFRRPFKLSSLNFRECLKGYGLQDMHADWAADRDGTSHGLNSIWLLDDMTKANGATRLVPGSHKRPIAELHTHESSGAPAIPGEIQVEEPAGTVIVYHAQLWHGGGHNNSGARRRVLHGYYSAREHKQQIDQVEYLRERTAQRLTPAARWLLDV
jgi:ectoine hydroxylase-related dioxygenase (phytanoyl-CoA dioxygenase family)